MVNNSLVGDNVDVTFGDYQIPFPQESKNTMRMEKFCGGGLTPHSASQKHPAG